MYIVIDIIIAVIVPCFVCSILVVISDCSKWDRLSAVQFGIASCLVGINIVLFVHHSTPTVDGLMTADLAFLVNGTFFQVVFWVSECWDFESKSWSYGTLVVGLVSDSLAIANTSCAIRNSGWTRGNMFAFSLCCLDLSLPIILLMYELCRTEAWPRITSLRTDKRKKMKHSRKPSTGSP
ncbi:uncharacterized protein EAF01_000589 [Botrytis porri]|uniref:uncharacterized protein n=1 Tax=Botrytis porri TaxID=87229 RepID=UPI0019006B21|nr:uncharacterized protein EAF01_000589 [Botrytis porri]KAF7914183.1 hypothetical protein EAF01_000589 [Botrytis porri]